MWLLVSFFVKDEFSLIGEEVWVIFKVYGTEWEDIVNEMPLIESMFSIWVLSLSIIHGILDISIIKMLVVIIYFRFVCCWFFWMAINRERVCLLEEQRAFI